MPKKPVPPPAPEPPKPPRRYIEEVLNATKSLESPKSFWYWAWLVAISAVVKKNLYLDKFAYKLYPNIFVILTIKSGGRKGAPISFAKKLVDKVDNTRIIAGRNSIQAIIKDLSGGVTEDDGKGPKARGQAFLISEELSTLLIEDDSATSILTTLYDTHAHDKWENTLKGDGKEIIHHPCLTILGASNMTLLETMLPKHAFTGGFIGRTMIVAETKRANKNSLMEKPEGMISDGTYSVLVDYLKKISLLRGEFIATPSAKKLYDNWYMAFCPEDVDDNTGTSDRVHDQILKVAMLLSLSRSTDLYIHEEDMQDGIDICLRNAASSIKMSEGSGQSDIGKQAKLVLQELLSKPGNKVTRQVLLTKYWSEFDALTLDKIIHTFSESKAVYVLKEGKDIMYILAPEVVAKYKSIASRVH